MDGQLAEDVEPTGEPSKLDTDALYLNLKKWFIADMEHSAEWRRQAKADFGFAAGDQWSNEDAAALSEQKRPVITFNRALSIIKAVAGIEINGRHDTVYLPRGNEPGSIKANELLTSASQWMADGCDAEDEQSEAFQDAIIVGMGWTEARISYEEDPNGMYVETKVDPLEMYWDRSARAKNLNDARRVFRVRKMSLDEARDFAASIGATDMLDDDLDASWAVGAETEPGKAVEERRRRDENSQGSADNDVYIVHAQWIERKSVFRVGYAIPGEQPQEVELDHERFEEFEQLARQNSIQYTHVRQTRKIYKHAFLGKVIIGEVMDCPAKDTFTYSCITGERDRNKGTWFGLIRLMRDPQMWANKWLSQTLHILNTTAKGGILAEKNAFEDQREAQDTYAQPDAITFTAPGAIKDGRIMQKPGVGIPTAYVNLLEFAVSSIRDVTGINLELLGMRDANQPGVLEAQRKQAAMTILATMFDSLRRFRKNVGRVRLVFIQTYLADGRMIRVAGQDGMQAVPLIKDHTLGKFEVIIDDSPTSPNQKQETWQFIIQLMPMLKDFMTPEVALTLLEFSPLPSKVVESLKELAQKASEPNADAEQQKQLMIADAMSKIEVNKTTADKNSAGAAAARAKGVLDLANAAVAGAQANLARHQADLLEGTPSVGITDEFIVEPSQSDQNQVPQAPTMPTVPNGVQN